MKILFIACIGLCCALSQNAFAQKNSRIPEKKAKAISSATWEKEPDSFLGIKFGEQLPGSVRMCKGVADEGDTVCLSPTSLSDYFEVESLPSLGFGYSVSMKSQNGVPQWIAIKSARYNFSRLESAFLDRYGPPTTSEVITVRTLGGADLQSRRRSWAGTRIRIDMDERSGTVDESGVMISDIIVSQEDMQKNNEISKKGASKF